MFQLSGFNCSCSSISLELQIGCESDFGVLSGCLGDYCLLVARSDYLLYHGHSYVVSCTPNTPLNNSQDYGAIFLYPKYTSQ